MFDKKKNKLKSRKQLILLEIDKIRNDEIENEIIKF